MINEIASNSNSFQLLNQNLFHRNESSCLKMNTDEENLRNSFFDENRIFQILLEFRGSKPWTREGKHN
jgi:hypothetical protein